MGTAVTAERRCMSGLRVVAVIVDAQVPAGRQKHGNEKRHTTRALVVVVVVSVTELLLRVQ